jgi:hypothetical protein
MKYLILTLSLVLAGTSYAQDSGQLKAFKTPLFSTPNTLKNNTALPVWFEIVVPLSRESQPWTDARDQQENTTGKGIGFSFNWELFGNRATERDTLAKNLLRSVGLHVDAIFAENSNLEGYGDKVFVKHTGSSFAVGGYVPLYIAQRIALNFGALARRHNSFDGARTNDDKDDSDDPVRSGNGSLASYMRIAYRLGPAEFGLTYEKSFKGFDYKAMKSSIGFRW